MKAMVCEMCNGNDLVKQDGMYVCQNCGTKYSVEEAKKLFVEGTVSIDNSVALENYLTLARRARDEFNAENAQKYYALVAEMNPNDWESTFFSVYFQSANCIIGHIASACNAISNILFTTTFKLIDKLENEAEKELAIETVATYCITIAETMRNSAINHYNSIGDSVRSQYIGEKDERCKAASLILLAVASGIESRGIDKYAKTYSKLVGNLFATHNGTLIAEAKVEYVEKWAKCDPATANIYISNNYTKVFGKTREGYLRVWKTINPEAGHISETKETEVAIVAAKFDIKSSIVSIIVGILLSVLGIGIGFDGVAGVIFLVIGIIIGMLGILILPKSIINLSKAKKRLKELKK